MISQYTLTAFYDMDRIHQDMNLQKIIAVLSLGGTDRSHIVDYTGIPDQTIGWRLKELREAGLIYEEGTVISTHHKKASRINLMVLK